MWRNDSDFGPLLSAVIMLLVLCIVFLGVTLPFSAVLHSDPGTTIQAIGSLAGLVGGAFVLQGKIAEARRAKGKTRKDQ